MAMSSQSSSMQQCIDNCLACYRACAEAKIQCARHQKSQMSHEELSTLSDCAQICQTASDFMIWESKRHGQICAVCAKICEECATVCEDSGDDSMRACAEACRRCAQSCQQMAGQMVHA